MHFKTYDFTVKIKKEHFFPIKHMKQVPLYSKPHYFCHIKFILLLNNRISNIYNHIHNVVAFILIMWLHHFVKITV